MRSLCIMGAGGSSRGELGGADGFLELRCGSWSWQGRSVEQTTRFDERICSSSRESAVDGLCASFTAW